MYTKDIPDPDILIRTGGHQRLSNFMLWQLAIRIIFISKLWPDFNPNDLEKVLKSIEKEKEILELYNLKKNLKIVHGPHLYYFFTFLTVKSNLFLVFTLIILGVLSIIEFINLINKIFKNYPVKLITNFFYNLYFYFHFLFFLFKF